MTGILALILWGAWVGLRFMRTTGISPTLVVRLLFDDGITLKNSDNSTNVLLMGVGGGTHDGSDLTDTMIILSLDKTTRKAAFISLPRDIWSDTLRDKINSAYHYGEEKKQGGGLVLSKVIAEDVAGIPIQYGLVIDFSGFKEIIDLMGGIDVVVSKAFTDTEYPIDGKEHDTCPGDPTNRCVYETISFEQGLQHMDGNTALKYVRSRHAEGEEGTDFARGRRQQDVLVALKNKAVHPFEWVTMSRLKSMPAILTSAVTTDMNIGELATVLRMYTGMNPQNVNKVSIESLLTNPPSYLYDGKYVLAPTDNWDTVHQYIKSQMQ